MEERSVVRPNLKFIGAEGGKGSGPNIDTKHDTKNIPLLRRSPLHLSVANLTYWACLAHLKNKQTSFPETGLQIRVLNSPTVGEDAGIRQKVWRPPRTPPT